MLQDVTASCVRECSYAAEHSEPSCMQSLWLIASQVNAWAVDELKEHVPEVQKHHPVLIDHDDFADRNATEAPSTGFIGMQPLPLICTHANEEELFVFQPLVLKICICCWMFDGCYYTTPPNVKCL